MRLIKAHALKKSFMSGAYPPWIDRNDNVYFEIESFISNSEAAFERKMKAVGDHAEPGRKYYPVAKTRDGGPMPTMRQWNEDLKNKSSRTVNEAKRYDRPPTLSGLGPVLEEPVED